MTNEERAAIKKRIKDLIREWNQAEEFGQSVWADKLMVRIQKLQAKLDEEV